MADNDDAFYFHENRSLLEAVAFEHSTIGATNVTVFKAGCQNEADVICFHQSSIPMRRTRLSLSLVFNFSQLIMRPYSTAVSPTEETNPSHPSLELLSIPFGTTLPSLSFLFSSLQRMTSGILWAHPLISRVRDSIVR